MQLRMLILLILTIVFACENEPKQPKSKKAKPIHTSEIENIEGSINETDDTITKHYYSGEFYQCNRNFIESVSLNDSIFELVITSELLMDDSLLQTEIVEEDSVVHRYVFHGMNELYSFKLMNDNKECFNTKIDRRSFIGKIQTDILLDNARFDIKLIEYAPKFDAFVFAIDFSIPDSDVGSEILFLLNKKGEIIENVKSQSFGSSTAYRPIQISQNGKMILSANNLLISNHNNVMFDQKTEVMSSDYIFDDNYVLVVYEYNDSLNRLNAKILDTTGRIQSVFHFEGYTCELSCKTEVHFIKNLNSYYLFDYPQQQFRKLRTNPIRSEIIPLIELEEHLSVDSNQIKISFDFNQGKQDLYIDTITGTMKYVKPEIY
ncbi:MAG: hypothetical protein MK066_11470 [Crocinitomicaceae bacterium]|nr:hypothetical protein [Crocinitomicaceae bacterium]